MLFCVWKNDWLFSNELKHWLGVLAIHNKEGREAHNHLVGQDTEGPPIDTKRVPLVTNYFWTHIRKCPAESRCYFILLQVFCYSEISEADVAILLNEHIFWL